MDDVHLCVSFFDYDIVLFTGINFLKREAVLARPLVTVAIIEKVDIYPPRFKFVAAETGNQDLSI